MINSLFCMILLVFCTHVSIAQKESSIIQNCTIELPSLLNKVNTSISDSVYSVEDLKIATSKINDSLTIIKMWYLGVKKMSLFPAYIGDAWFSVRNYKEAINIYQFVIPCAVNEKGRQNEWECYLYYKIGKSYEEMGDKNIAIEWYRKAINKIYSQETGKTKEYYDIALCSYRCLMNIRCDKQ
ncbi:MAG: tetratricopeptide repeat protein [Bacteroidia bacterium]